MNAASSPDATTPPARPGGPPGRLHAALARSDHQIEAPPGIVYTEALDDGRTLSISPQVEALLGCSQDEWMADPLTWVTMMHPEDRERVMEACWDCNRTEEPFRAEYRMIARDGRVLWFRDEAAIVRGSAGQRLCWQGLMVDITAEKQSAEAVEPVAPGEVA